MKLAALHRLLPRLEWLLLAVFSSLLAFHTMPRAWRTLNTDFPNYYLAAQLTREHYDLTHIYEWRWLQREKDHRSIDQRLVGLTPITPFSTLLVYPLTVLAPLPAKHLWLLLQLALLVPISLALRSFTAQPLRRIALLTAACLPLHRNLLYGQFYILLLALLVTACWAYRRHLSVLSGALIAIATMLKIFPVIFLLYFLRKRDWRALTSAILSLLAMTAISLATFGWSVHRTYFQVILPATLRGEALPPYLLSASSISALLHRLFIYEPQWNPHPWHTTPWLVAILAPLLQTLLLAPAILLVPTQLDQREHSPLEWSALLTATLATSTIPASYNFTLLIFPVVVLCSYRKPRLGLIACLLFFAIGYTNWNTSPVVGLYAILHVPRLFLLIAFTLLCYWTLRAHTPRITRSNLPWSIAFASFAILGIISGLKHQRSLFDDYPYRLPMQPDALLSAAPSADLNTIALLPQGYRLTPATTLHPSDQLSFASASTGLWIEEVNASSTILPPTGPPLTAIQNARSPILSSTGDLVAYIHDERGSGQLFSAINNEPLTPTTLNVEEAAALPNNSYLVAATSPHTTSSIFETHPDTPPTEINLGEARYPAVSPDGHYIAYSHFQSGAWNLWLLDRTTNQSQRLTHADCNQVEPAWEPDSKTLIYASDCGRALGFTALCRRRFIP
jgi:hypothetical protein